MFTTRWRAQADDGPYITVNREEHADRVIYRYRDPENEIRYPACGLVSIPVESAADNAAARIMTLAHLNTLTSPAFVAGLDRGATDLGDRFIRNNEKLGDSLPEVEEWLDGTGLVQLYDATMLDEVAESSGGITRRAHERSGGGDRARGVAVGSVIPHGRVEKPGDASRRATRGFQR